MSFETGLVIRFLFQMLIGPLVFHLCLEVFADFKVNYLFLECLLHQNLVNIFEVNLIGHTLIGLDFIFLEDLKNFFVFNYNHFFVLNEEGIFIIH